jgi:hypothetical protein
MTLWVLTLVHGYIAEYDKGTDHLLTFAKATPDRKTRTVHQTTLRQLTAAELARVINDANEVSGRTSYLSRRLIKEFGG